MEMRFFEYVEICRKILFVCAADFSLVFFFSLGGRYGRKRGKKSELRGKTLVWFSSFVTKKCW